MICSIPKSPSTSFGEFSTSCDAPVSHRRFQVLTKRPKTMAYYVSNYAAHDVPDNVWMGTSVESADYLWRIDALRDVPAKIRFLSLEACCHSNYQALPMAHPGEPLLDDLGDFDLSGIHWVIVGGESGPGARPMQEDWVLNILEQCDRADTYVPFFFKQWGGVQKSRTGRELLGKTWDAMPVS